MYTNTELTLVTSAVLRMYNSTLPSIVLEPIWVSSAKHV